MVEASWASAAPDGFRSAAWLKLEQARQLRQGRADAVEHELHGHRRRQQPNQAGRIDALFVTEATPSPALQALASERDDVRSVSIEPDVVAALSEAHFAYYPRTVEAHT